MKRNYSLYLREFSNGKQTTEPKRKKTQKTQETKMPRIADYSIITDSRFTIQTSGDIDQDFNFSLERPTETDAGHIPARGGQPWQRVEV
jgi:hypothetical protein